MTDAKKPNRLAWIRCVLGEYEAPLTRYAARITGDIDLARDVVQETFLRLCAQDQAEVDGRLPQWLYTVCRSRALDVRRKEGRMQALSDDQVKACPSTDRDPARVAERREGTGRVLQALAILPDNQQEVVRLRFQGGLSYKEIAGVTGLTVTNVGYLIHTAIKAIRERLKACPQSQPRQ